MATPVGALRAELSATAAAFEADLGRARKALGLTRNEFESLKSVVKAAGLAFVSAVAGLGAIAKSTANAGDELAKMSRKLGVSVEDLSALKHAADLANVPLEGLQTGMRTLSARMLDASHGLKEAERSFAGLGVKVKQADGSLRPLQDVLFDVADRFATMTDSTKRAALAQEIFGRAGLELIPLLEGGSAAIREQMAEAKRLGIVWTTEAALAAEAFNDNLTRLGNGLEGVKLAIGNAVIPILNELAKDLLAFVQSDRFRQWVQDIAELTRVGLPEALKIAEAAFRAVGVAVLGVASGVVVLHSGLLGLEFTVKSAGVGIRKLLGIEQSLGVTTAELERRLAEIGSTIERNNAIITVLGKNIQTLATGPMVNVEAAAARAAVAVEKIAVAGGRVRAIFAPMSEELKRAAKELTEGLLATEKAMEDLEQRASEMAEASAIETMRSAAKMKSFWQQQLEAIKESAATTWSAIQQGFSSAVAGVIMGTATMRDFFRAAMSSLIQGVVNLVVQMGVNWALAQTTKTAADTAMVATHTAMETAMTAVTAAQETARTGIVLASNKAMLGAAGASLIAIGAAGEAAMAVMGAVVIATAAVFAAIAAALTASIVGAPLAPAYAAAAAAIGLAGGAAVATGIAAITTAIGVATGAIGAALAAPMAHGGIVTGETLAFFEGAKTETVLPFDIRDMGGIFGGAKQTIIVQVDGRTIAKAALFGLPEEARVRAGLRTA